MTVVRTRTEWALDVVQTGIRRLAERRPTIGYIGWTVAENLGDDAMFEAAQVLLPGQPLETFRGRRREQMLALLGLSGTRTFSRIFLGGGTLINYGFLDVVRRAVDFGVPLRTLGTGVGSAGFSATSEAPPEDWRVLLAQFEEIGVRGPLSLERLRALGVPNAQVVGDLALALTPDAPRVTADATYFLLNAAAPKSADPVFPSETVFSELAIAAKRLMALGLEPLPVAFCEDDLKPLQIVMARAGIIGAIARPRTAAAFFDLASSARLSLGVRLHCAVLSVCAGLAPLTIAYRCKGKDFAASVGLDDWMVDPSALGLAERAAVLADVAPKVGATAHTAALHWREKLRKYVSDV